MMGGAATAVDAATLSAMIGVLVYTKLHTAVDK